MNKVVAVLNQETLAVVDWYFIDSPVVPSTPGVHVEVPTGLTWDSVKGVFSESGDITLTEDPIKVQAKTDSQWVQVRAQRNQLLKDSDWTCSVTDYEVPNKSEWIAYRAALRNVTEQADPFAITWPVKNS